MKPLRSLAAIACPLPLANIDTDQLIPARFMKQPRSAGYGGFLLYDHRFNKNGDVLPDFPLNRPERRDAKILVTRKNFGGGSSREAAAYALVDYGIRCVIAPSFGDIFASNAVNNGLLPARVDETDAEKLLSLLELGTLDMTVDLERCTIAASHEEFSFMIDPIWRSKLLNGWDDIDLTLSYASKIAEFAQNRQHEKPWVSPR
jgi:3-isopropylmalate/(R)-2-methylmalate dehydratase small subunit